MSQINENTILRLAQVREATGLSRSTIYEYMRRGDFPASRQLGLRAIGWISSEIFQWIATRTTSK